MSTAKEKKYARRMRNQPSNVNLEQGDRTPQGDGQGAFHSRRGSTSGQRGPYHSQGGHAGGGRGRGGRGESDEGPQIPKYITASMFAQARAAEINAMVKAVSQKSSNSLVFQSLPRHMRRRTMGHDIKRLPRRLREIAKREMEKSVHQKKEVSKSKCRKARRRHGNLRLEFNRRQRKNIWLETHIWFTKRFHMVKKWGYCLGDRPTLKCYRACYRAMSNHCLLQDLSYLCCVEVMGKEDDLLKALSKLCSIETGPTFAAASCLSGRRQGSLVMYKDAKRPTEALGPVNFIWKPKTIPESSCDIRQLWIWMHPAQKQDILKELRLVCVCEDRPDNAVCLPVPPVDPPQEEKSTTVKTAGRKRKMQDEEGEKAVPVKRIIGDGTRDSPDPYQWTSKETTIIIRDLTMEIVRYRLVGPLSHCVINDVLHPAPIHKKTEDRGPHIWWEDYCQNSDNNLLHENQSSFFHLLQGIAMPAQMPPGTILGLTVGDPRVNLPKKKTKSLPNLQQYEADGEKVKSLTVAGVPVECSKSLIWSSEIRSQVMENKIPEQEINRLRSELLVPGSRLDLGNKESKIPILLIQHPGKTTGRDQPGWGSGWDICLPKGWGMAFWIPLIYRGVRVGGLQQELQHVQYMGAPHVPGDFPDSQAGVQSALEKEAQLLEKYTKRPPAKRTNFIKHGILAPFLCPWKELTREWEMRAAAELDRSVQDDHGTEAGAEPTTSIQADHEAEAEAELDRSEQKDDHGIKAGAELDRSVQKDDHEAVARLTTSVQKEDHGTEAGAEPDRSVQKEEEHGTEEQPHHSKDIDMDSGSCVSTEQKLFEIGLKEAQGFSVLRNKKALRMLSAFFDPSGRKANRLPSPEPSSQVTPVLRDFPRALVWVRLSMMTKGTPELHSLICIPSQEDLTRLRKDKSFAGPQESMHRDPFKRKVVKQKKERRKQKAKSKRDGSEKMEVDPDLLGNEQLTLGLWPRPIPEVTTHCSRLLLGYVTQGDFSMAAGCGVALGFVSLTGLLHLLQQANEKIGVVLIRNPSSLQYRLAKLTIDT